jgi:hypothetical protein
MAVWAAANRGGETAQGELQLADVALDAQPARLIRVDTQIENHGLRVRALV